MVRRKGNTRNLVAQAVGRARSPLMAVGVFSLVINILGLTGSIYMLQVYDRVLASRSVATLVAVSVLALGLFVLQGVLEIVRGQVLSRVGAAIERDLLAPVHDLIIRMTLAGRRPEEVTQPVRDMESLRAFMSGGAPAAFLDLPLAPFYLFLIFLLHPWLGMLALGGLAVLVVLALVTEHRLREPTRAATTAGAKRQQAAETTRRNTEVLRAMGFEDRVAARFFRASGELFAATQRASDVAGTLGNISKTFRLMLQSAVLGLGAYLVVKGQMTAGAIIASSILSGRALAPVELSIANWKLFVAARQARARLHELIASLGTEPDRIDLPLARKTVSVEGVTVAPPGSRMTTLRNVRFELKAGDGLAVVGPSGAGKSTLARAMVGAWPITGGVVRLDGAPLGQWPVASLGRLIGYMPQDIELFDGTVAQNIARLDPNAKDSDVIAAAQAANVHDMILRLPHGYGTLLGEGGHNLSVGQRQRIGLARALYGEPFLVVLDEPNAHLDQEGEVALAAAIASIRRRGGVAVVVSHRLGIVQALDLAAIVADGELKAFGPRDEILRRPVNPPPIPQPSPRPIPAPAVAAGRALHPAIVPPPPKPRFELPAGAELRRAAGGERSGA